MNRTLSPKELARAIDVSESSLKRWADVGTIRAARTAGGHRRITLGEALRFIRESRMSLVRPEALGIYDLASLPTDFGANLNDPARLLEYLEAGNSSAVRGFLLRAYLDGESIAEMCDGPIQSAMEHLGRAWRNQPDGVFLEHRATDICLQSLDQLRGIAEIRSDAPVVLGGAPTGDPYILPSVMAATSLAVMGIHAVNLGPDTPAGSIVAAAGHYDASTVWLSVTSDTATAAELEAYVDELISGFPRPLTVVIGGRASHKLRHLSRDEVRHLSSMTGLVSFARDRFDLSDATRG